MRFGRHAFLAVVGALAAGCESISRDSLRCEEAVAHVMECCPGLSRPPVECVGSGSLPFVNFPNVECLIDSSCADMQARGVCAWASAPSGKVCP